ncbi:MAG TPA: PQQ-binding-like beta-propeller repeat protein [Gemmataceae bacterium]|nr:PQQ-binding-like beta-propeller repeat protein [Gemmataceae bacterium]
MKTRWLLLGIPVLCVGVTAVFAADWPQWRGPDRTDVSKEQGLLQTWPEKGPQLAWKYDNAGLGFSCIAVVGDVLYTMGARNEEEYAIALKLKDGEPPTQLWAVKLGPIFIDNVNSCGDGPRATPTVDGNHVYCLSGHGELVCITRDKGQEVWRKSLKKDFKGEVMEHIPTRNWGFCESPLIDGNKLVCCPGGPDGWMIALDKTDGKTLWRTTGIKDQATNSSMVIAEIGGVRQYINSSYKGKDGAALQGIAAADGKVLWQAPLKEWDYYSINASPIVFKDAKEGELVYASSSKGCGLFKIEKTGDGAFTAVDKYDAKAKRNMLNEHGGMVLIDGHIYGYSDPVGWACQDLLSGALKWKEMREVEGKGSLTFADGNLYLLSEEGEVVLLKANSQAKGFWQEKGRFTLPALSPSRVNRPTNQGVKVWTHPVVANGRLYVRDQELIYCYQVK